MSECYIYRQATANDDPNHEFNIKDWLFTQETTPAASGDDKHLTPYSKEKKTASSDFSGAV